MANLPSGITNLSTIKLTGPHNFFSWNIHLRKETKVNFGNVGQAFLLGRTPKLEYPNPGTPPDETDLRKHPVTKKTMQPHQLVYAREKTLPDETASLDGNSLNSLEQDDEEDPFRNNLTKEGQINLTNDKKEFGIARREHLQELVIHRNHDDALYKFILSSMDTSTQNLIEMHKDFSTLENQPPSYIGRARDYYQMVKSLLSTGNHRLASQNLLNLMNASQGETPFAEFLTNFENLYEFTAQSLEDPDHKGYVKLDKIKFMLFLHTLNRNIPANKQALNNYFSTHLNTEPDSKALINAVLTQSLGELAETPSDPLSEQGSALITTQPKTPFVRGNKKPHRTDHCKYCLKTSDGKLYFYHPEKECIRKKKDDAATAKPSTATAHLAAAAPPTTQEILAATANAIADRWQAADNISMMSNNNNLSLP